MSDAPTPETDAQLTTFDSISKLGRRFRNCTGTVPADFARRLERERNQALRDNATMLSMSPDDYRNMLSAGANLLSVVRECCDLRAQRDEARAESEEQARLLGMSGEREARLMAERDDAREALAEWHDAALHVDSDHPDEMHCGCVPILRKQLKDARAEAARLADELKKWQKNYYDVADTICRESSGVEDLCRQARETREERNALKAEVARLRATS
jgi:hypothetical protein